MLDPITLTNETAVLKAVARDWETQVNDLSSAEMKVIAEHLEQSLLPRLHLELALLQHQSIITPVTIDLREDAQAKVDLSTVEDDLMGPVEKVDYAIRASDDLQDLLERQKNDHAKEVAQLEAELEAQNLRLDDLQHEQTEFHEEIEEAAIHPVTGKIMAERVVRYFEEQIRNKEAIIEKMRLKNTSYRTQTKKLNLQLRQKVETGDVLQAIDYEQLSIENSQYQASLDEKNKEMLSLKTLAGRTIHSLNQCKGILQDLSKKSEQHSEDILSRQVTLEKLKREMELVRVEKERVQQSNNELQTKMDDYSAPEIMQYVLCKAKSKELEAAVKTWSRRVKIQQAESKKVIKATLATTTEKPKTTTVATIPPDFSASFQ